ncbi:MAG TPA: hypothetical protein VFY79_02610 [Dehalococcoidia bacterium]|nr:hypothetical protein [Dehalococcoidia bacterium]
MSNAAFSDDSTDQGNRFALVVVALVLLFVAVLVVLLAWGAPDRTITRVADFAGYLRDHNNRDAKLIITLGAAVVALLMLTVIIIEVTPSPIQKMRLRNVKAGSGTITTVEIAQRIEAEVRTVAHIRDCTATVAARGKRIDVMLDLHVDANADLSETADAACVRTQTLVERAMSIQLAQRPRARMHYRELRLRDEPGVPADLRQAPFPTGSAWTEHAETAGESGTEGERDDGTRDTDTSQEAQA